MAHTTDTFLADEILAAPALLRLGLAAPSERLRQQAANELAHRLVVALDGTGYSYDDRQIALPL